MCQSHDESGQYARPAYSDPFPWHLGAFDAHCHPTDTIASTASIRHMRTRALTIMATRSQDQHLVSQVSNELGVPNSESLAKQSSTPDGLVIPAFGWHPWFSHQLYDDSASSPTYPSDETDGPEERKQKHYSAVLAPSTITPDFLASLPTPTPISQFISSTRSFLQSHPSALAVNLSTETASAKSIQVIREVPDDRLLVESDLHVAGEQMDAALEAMYRKVCEIKGWSLEDGVVRIRKNFEAFIFG
ncbi:unnamed protein product [Clonostachys rosea f. rosea IK726]|uniref:Cut9 interacting protein Scn1 n=2 Tax=Bionectria ochroleuca TaxID=29856 RepID=A0A0B7JL48_BIOOC|nr:unnamed protein product [Clonostachys rosea f. rosea IK726]